MPEKMEKDDRVTFGLALGAAERNAGNLAEAKRWETSALEAMQQGGIDYMQAGALMTETGALKMSVFQDLNIPPGLKAVLATDLAWQHSDTKNDFLNAARQLNVQPVFPFHLVRRLTAPAP